MFTLIIREKRHLILTLLFINRNINCWINWTSAMIETSGIRLFSNPLNNVIPLNFIFLKNKTLKYNFVTCSISSKWEMFVEQQYLHVPIFKISYFFSSSKQSSTTPQCCIYTYASTVFCNFKRKSYMFIVNKSCQHNSGFCFDSVTDTVHSLLFAITASYSGVFPTS